MVDKARHKAFMSAVVTEHFVPQTGATASVAEAGSRAALYLTVLSSALVALGFAAQLRTFFDPFVARVLPAVFVLGLFTIVRLVDTAIEDNRFLTEIAQVRRHDRTLSPEAAAFFAGKHGRWPEEGGAPTVRLGNFVAVVTTTASMIAFVNNVVAGAGIGLLGGPLLGRDRPPLAIGLGVLAALALTGAFLASQRWRYETDRTCRAKPPVLGRNPGQGRYVGLGVLRRRAGLKCAGLRLVAAPKDEPAGPR